MSIKLDSTSRLMNPNTIVIQQNLDAISQTLATQFQIFINYMPTISRWHGTNLRSLANTDPIGATEELLSLVIDEDLWDEFFKALDRCGLDKVITQRYFKRGPSRVPIAQTYQPYVPPPPPPKTRDDLYWDTAVHNLNPISMAIAEKIVPIIEAMPSMKNFPNSINYKARARSDPLGVARDLLVNDVKTRNLWNEFFDALKTVGLTDVWKKWFV